MEGNMLRLTILFIGFQLRCAHAMNKHSVFVVVDMNFGDMNPEYIDPDYSEAKIVNDSDPGVTILSKIKVVKDFPKGVMYHFNIQQDLMGASQQQIGLTLTGGLCENVNDTIIVSQFFDMTGFSKEKCPPTVGTYGNEQFYGRMDGPLDALPTGKYKSAFRVYRGNETIFTINGAVDLF